MVFERHLFLLREEPQFLCFKTRIATISVILAHVLDVSSINFSLSSFFLRIIKTLRRQKTAERKDYKIDRFLCDEKSGGAFYISKIHSNIFILILIYYLRNYYLIISIVNIISMDSFVLFLEMHSFQLLPEIRSSLRTTLILRKCVNFSSTFYL